MSGFRIRAMIVDDNRSFLGAASHLLSGIAWIDLAGTACSAEEAFTLIQDLQPGLVLMDIALPGVDGLEATRRIRNEHPDIRVVVMTMMTSAPYQSAALDAGADGFVMKSEIGRTLLPLVEQIFARERDSNEP